MENITSGSIHWVTFCPPIFQKYIEEYLEYRCTIKIEIIHSFYAYHSLRFWGSVTFFFLLLLM